MPLDSSDFARYTANYILRLGTCSSVIFVRSLHTHIAFLWILLDTKDRFAKSKCNYNTEASPHRQKEIAIRPHAPADTSRDTITGDAAFEVHVRNV